MHVTRMFGVISVLAFMSLGAEGINHWNIEYFIIQYKVKTISDTTSISCHVHKAKYIWSGWMRMFPKRGDLYPGDAELAEYLSYLRDGYDQDTAGTKLD